MKRGRAKVYKNITKNQTTRMFDFTLLILLVSALLILISRKLVFIYNKTSNATNPSLNISSTPTLSYPIDTENDGVYTNYKYKFRFNYPVHIFDANPKHVGNDIVDPYGSEGWYSTSNKYNELFLSAGIYPQNKEGYLPWELYKSFQEVYDLDPGSKFLSGNGTKIRNVSKNGVDGVLLYYRTPNNVNWQLEYYYHLEFVKDGFRYGVILQSIDYKTLSNNKKIFEDIVSSFEFF